MISSSHLLSSDCEMVGNQAEFGGGAIFLADEATSAWSRLNCSNNTAVTDNGGCFSVNDRANVLILDSIVEGNSAYGGGGLSLEDSCLATLNRCRITKNQASSGGGVFVQNLSIYNDTGSSIVQNSASKEGGGIFANGKQLALETVLVHQNRASYGGGLAIAYDSESNNWSNQCTFR